MVNKSSGMGFPEVLTLIFIVLKLTNVIEWSWIWVLSPIAIVLIVIGLLQLILAFLESAFPR